MERHTLHDTATNATGQNQSSHSYSAWRTAQQTQPRILQYTPPTSQQTAQQQQQTAQQAALSNQAAAGGAAAANISAAFDNKNLIFTNSERLAQQYNMQNTAQAQAPFTTLQEDPTAAAQNTTDPSLTQPTETPAETPEAPKQVTPQTIAGRVLSTSKRAAQNRAAQRAFRLRKDRYIKSLEEKANQYDLSHSIIADLRKENIYLRDYVVRLQNEVDSLNTELGRAPMFGTPSQRAAQAANQAQQASLPVSLAQNYSLQIDPQTAAAAAAAAAANVHAQDAQAGLAPLAPATAAHTAISMPAGNEATMVEPKHDESPVQPPKKTTRGRKRKIDVQETQ